MPSLRAEAAHNSVSLKAELFLTLEFVLAESLQEETGHASRSCQRALQGVFWLTTLRQFGYTHELLSDGVFG